MHQIIYATYTASRSKMLQDARAAAVPDNDTSLTVDRSNVRTITSADLAYPGGSNNMASLTLTSGVYQLDSSVTYCQIIALGDVTFVDSDVKNVDIVATGSCNLTLDNVKIDNSTRRLDAMGNGCIYYDNFITGQNTGTLNYVGKNTLIQGFYQESAISVSNMDLVINGSGELNIYSSNNLTAGIGTDPSLSGAKLGTVTINSGNLSIYNEGRRDETVGIGELPPYTEANSSSALIINGGVTYIENNAPGGTGIHMPSVVINDGALICSNKNADLSDPSIIGQLNSGEAIKSDNLTVNNGYVLAIGGIDQGTLAAVDSVSCIPTETGVTTDGANYYSNVSNNYLAKVTAPRQVWVETTTIEQNPIYTTQGLSVWIQPGCEANDGMYVEIERMDTRILGIDDLNLSTTDGAIHALDAVKSAQEKIASNRSKIGAQQNRLAHTIANEENVVENTTAAESRIRDADMASEMVALANFNILQQAGQTILAQANQSNQGVITLLNN